MNSASRVVLERVTIAYHVIVELLKRPELLDTNDATEVANGLLERLQNAFADQPEFAMAVRELKLVSGAKRDGAGRAKRVATMLAVLVGVCEAFLMGSSGMGFHKESGGDA